MRQFRFRAVVTLDRLAQGGHCGQYPSPKRGLLLHARRIGQPSCATDFPAEVSQYEELPQPGEPRVLTLTVTGDDALFYLDAGQPFTLWGRCAGHGIISRRVFTGSGPS